MMRAVAVLAVLGGCGGGYDTAWDEPDDTAVDPNACPKFGLSETILQWDAVVGGGTPETRQLDIKNDCVGVLFLKVQASVIGDDTYTITPSELQISPGSVKSIEVTFDPRDLEEHRATLELAAEGIESAQVELYGFASSLLDADGDGFLSISDGGEDCDDNDAAVYPGAPDECYDDIDSACDGGDEFDCDGDGVRSSDYGGTDCDDSSAEVSPDIAESDDSLDNDCDGLIDEDFIEKGDLFITELMLKPSVGWQYGQWIEVYNTSDRAIDLNTWEIEASGGYAITIDESVLIEAGEFAVLGPGNVSTNGGVEVVWSYSSTEFALLHSGSTVTLTYDGRQIQKLTYYGTMVPPKGYSLQRDGAIDSWSSMKIDEWCTASSAWSSADFGTPGGVNDGCSE